MTRALALDVGTKTIGLALSDPTYLIAQAYKTIKRENLQKDLDKLEIIIAEEDIEEIIIGLPRHMNNDLGASAQRAKSLGHSLEERTGKTVIYQDERLTTVSAEMVMKKRGTRREKRKEYVDALAATFILQTWLDRKRSSR